MNGRIVPMGNKSKRLKTDMNFGGKEALEMAESLLLGSELKQVQVNLVIDSFL